MVRPHFIRHLSRKRLRAMLLFTPALALEFLLPLSSVAGVTGKRDALALESSLGAIRFGERVRYGSASIRPVRLVSDSRCPAGARCIQAGTVQILVEVTDGRRQRRQVMGMDEAVNLKPRLWLTLALVCPTPIVGQQIPHRGYRFTFLAGTTSRPRPLDAVCPPRTP